MMRWLRIYLLIVIFGGWLLRVQPVSAEVGITQVGQDIQDLPVDAQPDAELQSVKWYDGLIAYSQIINCVSIIQGMPYSEYGIGTYAGFAADPDTARPSPGQVYYLHVVAYGLGNACSGQRIWVDFRLPANTSLAISQTNPVLCIASGGPEANCPQSLPASPFNAGAYSIPSPDSANLNTWPMPQGKFWEFRIPVVSSTPLTNNPFQAFVRALDGNSNPWLAPSVGVYVFSGTPNIMYPTPSTTISGTIPPVYKSTAFLYNYTLNGTVYMDLGTTTSYGYSESAGITNAYSSYEVFTDWSGFSFLPNTTYHWRLRFAASNGITYTGADQTFVTPSSGKLIVGSGDAVNCTGSALSTALNTGGVKEITFNCGPNPVVIQMTGTKIVNSALTIDGGNKVTLVAPSGSRHLEISHNLTLKNITLSGGGGSSCGGSVKINSGGWLTANRVQFINNLTNGDGGAICILAGGGAELFFALLKDNTAVNNGGALFNQGTVDLLWSDVSGNGAQVNGGGIWNGGSLYINVSLVSQNSVPGSAVARGSHEGGGIFNAPGGSLSITASTISGNTAYYAAGIFNQGADTWLTNVTLAANTATGGIGGLESKGSGSSKLRNTIVAGNAPGNCGTGYVKTITSLGNNLDSGSTCGFGSAGDKQNTDPRLKSLAFNGGFTRTVALMPGSPAIDAADNVYCGMYDQRGFSGPPVSEILSRNVDGDENGSIICDMGAFEFHPDTDSKSEVFLPLIRR